MKKNSESSQARGSAALC